MAQLRYDLIPQGGGWSIAMGGAVGPPYPTLGEALRDTEHVARFLSEGGDGVEVVIWQGGDPVVFERFVPQLQPPAATPRSAHAHPRASTRPPHRPVQ